MDKVTQEEIDAVKRVITFEMINTIALFFAEEIAEDNNPFVKAQKQKYNNLRQHLKSFVATTDKQQMALFGSLNIQESEAFTNCMNSFIKEFKSIEFIANDNEEKKVLGNEVLDK